MRGSVSSRAPADRKGYKVEILPRTSGPINAILLDHEHGTFWGGGSSDYGEDYGIGW